MHMSISGIIQVRKVDWHYGHHVYAFHLILIRMYSPCLFYLLIFITNYNFYRSQGFHSTKPFRRGISGKDKTSDLYQQRGAKLFATIVKSSGGVQYKKGFGVSEKFIDWKTRGKAVAIGPLEYCGNGIPLRRSGGKPPGAKKKASEKEKTL